VKGVEAATMESSAVETTAMEATTVEATTVETAAAVEAAATMTTTAAMSAAAHLYESIARGVRRKCARRNHRHRLSALACRCRECKHRSGGKREAAGKCRNRNRSHVLCPPMGAGWGARTRARVSRAADISPAAFVPIIKLVRAT
jgi:hypothetical protein